MESNNGMEQAAPLENNVTQLQNNTNVAQPQNNTATSKPKKGGMTIAGIILTIIGLLPGLVTAAIFAWIMATTKWDGNGEDPRGWGVIILLGAAAIPIILGGISFITGIILFFVGRSKDKKKVGA